MKKKLLKMLIISVTLVIFSCNMTVFAGFSDIDKHWAKEDIQNFVQKGYIEAVESEFNPDSDITKGELAQIVNHYFSYGSVESIEENLQLAESKGYLSNAISEEKITREEVAILICKTLSLQPLENFENTFIDNDQISPWAKGYIDVLAQNNIVVGYPDMTYKPQKNISKAEFITILNRCVGIGGSDIEFVDKDVKGIEVGIFEYEDTTSYIKPISGDILLNSGDKVNFALILAEDIDEEEILVKVDNTEIVEFDEEFFSLFAIKSGETVISFETEDKINKISFDIKVN